MSISISTFCEVRRIYKDHISDPNASFKKADFFQLAEMNINKITINDIDKRAGFTPDLIKINNEKEIINK